MALTLLQGIPKNADCNVVMELDCGPSITRTICGLSGKSCDFGSVLDFSIASQFTWNIVFLVVETPVSHSICINGGFGHRNVDTQIAAGRPAF